MPRHSEFQPVQSAARRSPPGRPATKPSPFREQRRIVGTLTLRTMPLRQPESSEGDRT